MEVEQGGRTKEEEEVVASRLLFFFSYWVAADWSLCHHLEVRVVSGSPVTLLSALFCQGMGLTSPMADPHLGFLAGL